MDGFNAHLLKHAPVGVRKAYWEALAEMVSTLTFPPEYKQWTAMLAMKGDDEDPRDLARRRDLWVVCHGQKLIMRMLNKEYEEVARAAVPLSQAGYARGRNAPEQSLVMRLVHEQNARDRNVLCVGFLDLGSFFMSCVRDVQWA